MGVQVLAALARRHLKAGAQAKIPGDHLEQFAAQVVIQHQVGIGQFAAPQPFSHIGVQPPELVAAVLKGFDGGGRRQVIPVAGGRQRADALIFVQQHHRQAVFQHLGQVRKGGKGQVNPIAVQKLHQIGVGGTRRHRRVVHVVRRLQDHQLAKGWRHGRAAPVGGYIGHEIDHVVILQPVFAGVGVGA